MDNNRQKEMLNFIKINIDKKDSPIEINGLFNKVIIRTDKILKLLRLFSLHYYQKLLDFDVIFW
jgi:hypothetical protein